MGLADDVQVVMSPDDGEVMVDITATDDLGEVVDWITAGWPVEDSFEYLLDDGIPGDPREWLIFRVKGAA